MEDLKSRMEKLERISEEHHNDIAQLKRRPIGGGEGGPALSTEDYDKLNLVGEIAKRLERLENDFKNLNLGLIKDAIKDLQDKTDGLQDSKADKSELNKLLEEMDKLRN